MASDNGNTDREIILADFQACTGIDNIAEAIALLELNNWDLVAAINVVIPQENGILQSNLPSEASESGSLFRPLAPMPPSVSTSTSTSPPSPSCPVRAARHALEHPRQPRMLSFRVEYRQRSVEVVLDEASTVGEIKQVLETELQIPASKLQLKGWKTGDVSDSTVLSSLHLPKNNSLYVLTPDIAQTASTSEARASEEALSQNFVLVVNHQETGRDYSLNFPGDRTIQEVKRNISDVTNIPVRHQQWEGWPVTATDEQMTLASSGISYPCHRLRVRRRSPTPTSTQAAQAAQAEQVSDIHMASDSEGDDFEDASEFGVDEAEIFGMGASGSRKSPMIPDDAENEDEALLHFTSEFKSRYGDLHPVFFIGSLESALQDAFYGKARDRKLLSIYLHHDESVLANVFCSQMLCAESVVSYLSQNFVTWAWDVTKEANKSRLLTMCTRHFGSMVTQAIRTHKTDNFPLFLIVMGKRASNEVLNVIQGILFAWNYTVDDLHVGRLLGNTTVGKLCVCLSLGNTTVDELMMRLMGAMEIFTAQQQEDIKDEAEREAREMVKREQDEAYRLSLEADRRKRKAQEKEEAELSRLEQMRREQEQEREAIRLSLEQALPPEPEEEDDQPISKLRIRTPSGDFLERRFLASCRLQALFDFVASKGYPCEEFKVITTYPRRNITDLDPSWTLLDAKLFPQETLFLEAKE